MIIIGRLLDLTGQQFERLKVIQFYDISKDKKARWLCECSCGNKNIIVTGKLLRSGHTKSCGCLSREMASKRMKKHERSQTRLYSIWCNMKSRCFNKSIPQYKDYGGRGITICDGWLSDDGFINFYNWSMDNGYLKNLTLDRNNVNGNYEPSNCRWVTTTIQNINQRIRKDNKSGQKGVHFDNKSNKWKASIKVKKQHIHLGYFENLDDAIKIRKNAEKKYFGINQSCLIDTEVIS